MKPSYLANSSVILALSGWLTYCIGTLIQMGDPAPMLSASELAQLYRPAKLICVLDILLLISALWLSGFTYSFAKKRSSIALVIVLLPSFFCFISTFFTELF